MHAVVRRYTGASALIDAMMRRRQEVEELLRGVVGFSAYYAIRTGDSLTTVTLCRDKAGTEESTQRAAAWVKRTLPSVALGAPLVTEGDVFLQFVG
jgi:hypothetical protein